jgi:hypothetical protein
VLRQLVPPPPASAALLPDSTDIAGLKVYAEYLHHEARDHPSAIRLYTRVATLAAGGNWSDWVWAQERITGLHLGLGQLNAARVAARMLQDRAQANGKCRDEFLGWLNLARVAEIEYKDTEALGHLSRAERLLGPAILATWSSGGWIVPSDLALAQMLAEADPGKIDRYAAILHYRGKILVRMEQRTVGVRFLDAAAVLHRGRNARPFLGFDLLWTRDSLMQRGGDDRKEAQNRLAEVRECFTQGAGAGLGSYFLHRALQEEAKTPESLCWEADFDRSVAVFAHLPNWDGMAGAHRRASEMYSRSGYIEKARESALIGAVLEPGAHRSEETSGLLHGDSSGRMLARMLVRLRDFHGGFTVLKDLVAAGGHASAVRLRQNVAQVAAEPVAV